ncbi:hypothetical protein TNCV_4621901 [Trichonephila clavipes]|nr:hypothetical protein TNCV_4621901 [Trichonephila clavipes]
MWNTPVRATYQQPISVLFTNRISIIYISIYDILLACRPVPRLNTSLSNCTSGSGSQMTTSSKIGAHKTFRSAPFTARLPGGIFQHIRNSMQRRCQICQTTSIRISVVVLPFN